MMNAPALFLVTEGSNLKNERRAFQSNSYNYSQGEELDSNTPEKEVERKNEL